MRVALAGNPNAGKTTLFNTLTGLRHHVGNWPGKTVEKKQGMWTYQGESIEVTDLPGTYSITPYAEDERVAKEALDSGAFDAIINIVDAANLEHHLYLTLQLLDRHLPVTVFLNMSRRAKKKGIRIDATALSAALGVPVIAGEANSEEAKTRIGRLLTHRRRLQDQGHLPKAEQRALPNDQGESRSADEVRQQVKAIAEMAIHAPSRIPSRSDRVDKIATGPGGIPLFLIIMAMTFQMTFVASAPLSQLIETGITSLGGVVGLLHLQPAWLASLVVDGIIGGIGAVLVFIPSIFLLFLLLSMLEDSGYMARAAYVMDRSMRRMGLHGKSFLPMVLGFGCNVPAVMATRTLEDRHSRLLTILLIPLMSCSARLPVYVLFAGAFFPARAGMVIFLLYILGILMALLMGILFRRTLFRRKELHLLLELPPYRLPMVKNTLITAWDRTLLFIRNAGTIILSTVLLIWFLASVPQGVAYASRHSLIGRIGILAAPLLSPLGFGFWEAAVALLFGIAAKEVIIGTFAALYGTAATGLGPALQAHFTPLSAASFLVFVLLYTPCAAALGAIRREAGAKWAAFTAGYLLVLAWIMAFLVFQLGTLAGWS